MYMIRLNLIILIESLKIMRIKMDPRDDIFYLIGTALLVGVLGSLFMIIIL